MRWPRTVFDRRTRTDLPSADGSCGESDDDHAARGRPKSAVLARCLAPSCGRQGRSPSCGDGRRRKSAISVGNNGSPTGGCPKQAVKTIACGTPDASGAFVVTTLVCFPLNRTRGHGRIARPAFRAPSQGGRECKKDSGAPAPLITGVMMHAPEKCEAVFGSGHGRNKLHVRTNHAASS